MGISIEVLIADWERLEATPAAEQSALLWDAFDDEDCAWGSLPPAGWVRPRDEDADWCRRYDFHNTLSSYKPHFWAGERWEDVRDHAAPGLRTALDHYLSALFWSGLPYMDGGDGRDDFEPECPWNVQALMWCAPDEVPGIKRLWERAAPELDTLRQPFAEHAADPGGWIENFDEFALLLKDWAEVVTEADRRGWGVIGLRC
ncbi:hypothetical protein ACWCXX_16160 [Streptomyces sp. NPDC001732]